MKEKQFKTLIKQFAADTSRPDYVTPGHQATIWIEELEKNWDKVEITAISSNTLTFGKKLYPVDCLYVSVLCQKNE
jgi:hypothetical protein